MAAQGFWRKVRTRASIIICLIVFVVSPGVLGAPLTPDEQQALDEWTNWVGNQCAPVTTNPSQGTGQPDGATFPNLDSAAMATSIDNFIQKENSNSALKGLGSTIVASGKNSNINPFLIVAIAHEESNLSDPGDYNIAHGNNSFGREATSSQPHFTGSHLWYKWSSVKASVDYTAPENNNAVGGGDMATYLRDQYGSSIDNSNLVSLFLNYAPPSENNTTQYINNVKGWVSDMVNGASQGATTNADASQSSDSCACSSSGDNLIGNDIQQKIFNFFVGKGLSPAQAAGIDGNFGQESSWNPSDSGGYLGQWGGNRLTALGQLAQQENKPITDLGVQLDYVWLELTGGSGVGEDDSAVLQHLKATTSPGDAATVFSNEYERPGDPQLKNRIMYANQIFAEYGSGSPASSACAVVCSGAGQNSGSLSQVRQNVVCIAQQELALWKSKPGYPTPAFSQNGYLKYSENRSEEWCADFASWAYHTANYPLQPDPNWNIPGVATIQSIGEKNTAFHWHPQSSGYTPKPGDLAIHGGNHVNIFITSSGNIAQYIGGDQGSGPYPGGSIVSIETGNGYYDNGITGYVSPD